jgi:hypothetical protein
MAVLLGLSFSTGALAKNHSHRQTKKSHVACCDEHKSETGKELNEHAATTSDESHGDDVLNSHDCDCCDDGCDCGEDCKCCHDCDCGDDCDCSDCDCSKCDCGDSCDCGDACDCSDCNCSNCDCSDGNCATDCDCCDGDCQCEDCGDCGDKASTETVLKA